MKRLGLILLLLLLSGCFGSGYRVSDGAPSNSPDVSHVPNATPRYEPRARYGNPASYEVNGRRYHVKQESKGYRERGIASWYGTKFHGKLTSTRERYDMLGMSAAHKSLPLPTYAEVTNLHNGRSVVVRINDRGPFHDNRLIDLSYAAAKKLGILAKGTGLVEVRAINPGTPRLHQAIRPVGIDPDASIYLQLGAFRDRQNAERLRQRVATEAAIKAIKVSEVSSLLDTFYRVRIGPLASVESADRITQQLSRHGIDPPRVVID
ncbi:hypothetical protein BOW53_09675 [Solemya pervernicosa gill symbiont]|uniref:Endolytic peptidoglycan transglycosylase RlpA n=2 Tax=Gammaproteobacteria incertae sedis TaxID=118884 RepID=A0A1T2L494_9GAMM|nr:septal ring lytic transglycosylase RlpA family protein [Candidatus Reidiella endopervernicosa]OOZ39927.1 hypothetical protein BOW53_09675 [Solemya pervernicosa gill symbiont]QKQ25980.1 septal ring lytic transglycosylase RlpA family protein [Candidatus Reidiella endopervernicosa]